MASRLGRARDAESAWAQVRKDFPDHRAGVAGRARSGAGGIRAQEPFKDAAPLAQAASKSSDNAVRGEGFLLLGESELRLKHYPRRSRPSSRRWGRRGSSPPCASARSPEAGWRSRSSRSGRRRPATTTRWPTRVRTRRCAPGPRSVVRRSPPSSSPRQTASRRRRARREGRARRQGRRARDEAMAGAFCRCWSCCWDLPMAVSAATTVKLPPPDLTGLIPLAALPLDKPPVPLPAVALPPPPQGLPDLPTPRPVTDPAQRPIAPLPPPRTLACNPIGTVLRVASELVECGRARFQRGELEDARDAFQKATKETNDRRLLREARYWLGETLMRLGRTTDAPSARSCSSSRTILARSSGSTPRRISAGSRSGRAIRSARSGTLTVS